MENAPVAASQGIATHGGCPAQIRSDDAIKQLDLVQGHWTCLDQKKIEHVWFKRAVFKSMVGWCPGFPYWMRIPNEIPIQPRPALNHGLRIDHQQLAIWCKGHTHGHPQWLGATNQNLKSRRHSAEKKHGIPRGGPTSFFSISKHHIFGGVRRLATRERPKLDRSSQQKKANCKDLRGCG